MSDQKDTAEKCKDCKFFKAEEGQEGTEDGIGKCFDVEVKANNPACEEFQAK